MADNEIFDLDDDEHHRHHQHHARYHEHELLYREVMVDAVYDRKAHRPQKLRRQQHEPIDAVKGSAQ